MITEENIHSLFNALSHPSDEHYRLLGGNVYRHEDYTPRKICYYNLSDGTWKYIRFEKFANILEHKIKNFQGDEVLLRIAFINQHWGTIIHRKYFADTIKYVKISDILDINNGSYGIFYSTNSHFSRSYLSPLSIRIISDNLSEEDNRIINEFKYRLLELEDNICEIENNIEPLMNDLKLLQTQKRKISEDFLNLIKNI